MILFCRIVSGVEIGLQSRAARRTEVRRAALVTHKAAEPHVLEDWLSNLGGGTNEKGSELGSSRAKRRRSHRSSFRARTGPACVVRAACAMGFPPAGDRRTDHREHGLVGRALPRPHRGDEESVSRKQGSHHPFQEEALAARRSYPAILAPSSILEKEVKRSSCKGRSEIRCVRFCSGGYLLQA